MKTKKTTDYKPEDLGIEIMSKDQKFWTDALAESELTIQKLERALMMEQAINETCRRKKEEAEIIAKDQ